MRALVPMLADPCAPGWRSGHGHRYTGDGSFGLGALGQDLGLKGCAVASPDEGHGVFDGVHLLLLVATMLAGKPASSEMGWLNAYKYPGKGSERLSIYSTMLNDVRGFNVGRAINELTDRAKNCCASKIKRVLFC